eukprot:9897148-Alexandrium_andersonii.AAC.1
MWPMPTHQPQSCNSRGFNRKPLSCRSLTSPDPYSTSGASEAPARCSHWPKFQTSRVLHLKLSDCT